MGDRRGAYRDFAGKREGRRPLGRHSRRWENNTKMDLQAVGWDGDILTGFILLQDRDRWRTLVNAVTNLRVP